MGWNHQSESELSFQPSNGGYFVPWRCMEITFGCNTLCESEKPTKEKTSMKQFSMLFFVLYPICSMYGTIRTRASWSVEERRSGLMAGEKHGIEDDFSCPIPDAILSEAAEIVSKRFKFDEANLHSANLGDVRIPQKTLMEVIDFQVEVTIFMPWNGLESDSVPLWNMACWQSSLPQGLALCCGACTLGDRTDFPPMPMLFFWGGSFSWPLLACSDPTLLFCSLFVVCGRVFLSFEGFSLPQVFRTVMTILLRFRLVLNNMVY